MSFLKLVGTFLKLIGTSDRYSRESIRAPAPTFLHCHHSGDLSRAGTTCLPAPVSTEQRVATELTQIAPRLRQAQQKRNVTLNELATSAEAANARFTLASILHAPDTVCG